MRKIVIFITFFACAYYVQAKYYLFNAGSSKYSIVVPQSASMSEKTAAEELQNYIKQISGITLTIKNKIPTKGNYIYIGYNRTAAKIKPSASSEAYAYKTIGGNLFIWGGADRGTMYGVFSFLENELGVRWYTSDYTKTPKRKSYELRTLNHSEKPYIGHRLDFYYTPLTDDVWCAHNKLNDKNGVVSNKYGNMSACNGIHTVYNLVPPTKYSDKHPEYYSKRNGSRQHEDGQLCLSNKDVLAITKASILKTIKDNPGYWVYDVSQMDNENFCQCENCMKIANKYGGQSGLMIWFVNQVADAVKKVYPTKKISTFAYQYTRHAPKGIIPRSNVVIRLCDIECCFSHPLSSTTCEKNKEFMTDLKAWGRISQNIYIWDYVVNFFGYLLPYPNFYTLGPNILTFASNHVKGILEEGTHECPWGAFSEMRTWVISKLLWNPKQDINKLTEEFCNDYYGNASEEVYSYYLMTQNIPSDCHVIYNTHYEKECYDEAFIKKSIDMLGGAVNNVSNNAILCKRVKRVLAQAYYLDCLRSHSKAKEYGSYKKLKTILKDDPTNPKEGVPDLDKVLNDQGDT